MMQNKNACLYMNSAYLNLLEDVVEYGVTKSSRAKLSDGSKPNTKSLTGQSFFIRHNKPDDFPVLTLRPVAIRNTIGELCTFLQGCTSGSGVSSKSFRDNGCYWWDDWQDDHGELGPIYGAQWRKHHNDQILGLIQKFNADPYSRRLFVSAWNPEELSCMALPPCHDSFQLITEPANDYAVRLNMVVRMRSCDIICGLPHNQLCYSILLNLFVKWFNQYTGHCVYTGSLTFQFGDLHLYENHYNAAKELLRRKVECDSTVSLTIRHLTKDLKPTPDDIIVHGYKSQPKIEGIEVAV